MVAGESTESEVMSTEVIAVLWWWGRENPLFVRGRVHRTGECDVDVKHRNAIQTS